MRSSPRGRGGGESEMPAGIRVKTGRERFGMKWVNRRVFERSSGRRRCDGVGRSYIELSPYSLPINFYDATWYATLQNRDKVALKAKPALELHTIIPVNPLPNA